MGTGRFDAGVYRSYQQKTATMSRQQRFTSSGMVDELNPLKFKIRESCDSPANPRSTPIILACDVTGSMQHLPEVIIKKDFGLIMEEAYRRVAAKQLDVTDPHFCCLAVGDTKSDHAPLQATQFEAEAAPMIEQLPKMYLEGNGGGNGGESYLLAHYFAALRTKTDAWLNRKQKGYLFTIGDEAPHSTLTRGEITRFLGDHSEVDLTASGLLDQARQTWEVFHLLIKPAYDAALPRWIDLMGHQRERVIQVDDHEHLGEIIISTMQVLNGADKQQVANSWSGSTAVAVASAIKDLVPSKGGDTAGVVTL